ncbi:MAG TPA: hypothetical protein VEH09_08855, partial [Thermodesulfobacteriota bacterium]|nr:hypothetical protein [Thermodesulfobacteriota bacterium]
KELRQIFNAQIEIMNAGSKWGKARPLEYDLQLPLLSTNKRPFRNFPVIKDSSSRVPKSFMTLPINIRSQSS